MIVRSALAAVLTMVVAAGDAGAVRAHCRGAQYAIAPVQVGDAETATVEIGTRVGLGTACPLVDAAAIKTSRRGVTTVRGRWAACPGVRGRVRLRARVVDDCTRVVGTIRAKGVRRRVEGVLADCGDGILDATLPEAPYVATRESLATHPLPRWFDDAKLGIMIHWGIFTIPAWAELVLDPEEWLSGTKLVDPPDYGRDWFTHIPYVEWYPNTILIPGSPAAAHHAATYGADTPYESFRPEFEAQAAAWSGEAWAELFRESGARYVVLVTKHHDGFALWPTGLAHPTRPGWHTERDVVGELAAAVRRRCMRMGLYYSGGLDWSVQPGPIQTSLDALTVAPQTPEYVAYADGQWRELIARYRPAVLWNDIGYPNDADELALFADYYNAVPDGLVNDRFTIIPTLTHYDYTTPEFSVVADIAPRKFETVRGMGRGFGYNRNESDADLASAGTLIRLLVDVASKNGNLLLNVGPTADGTVPAAQADRLRAIGAWLATNGEAIFGSRPWTRAEGATTDDTPVRFTQRADGTTAYAIVLGSLPAGAVTIRDVGAVPVEVRLLGLDEPLAATAAGADLRIELPAGLAASDAYAFALRW